MVVYERPINTGISGHFTCKKSDITIYWVPRIVIA